MTLLVAGGDEVDAGKTTFSVGLVDRLDATGFKPRAGNDYWFDHDDYLRAVGDGRLYGKDAWRLAAASASDVSPTEINPVHRLWRPAPGGDGFIGRSNRSFVLDRVSDSYVVNGDAEVPASAQEALPIADSTTVRDVDELNTVMSSLHVPRLEALAERIEATEPAIVESYGDVARPTHGVEIDRVAVVEPGRARIYDGDRYLKACDVASGRPRDGQLEERVGDVVALLEPSASVGLPALESDKRSDPSAVADVYADAYESLL